VASRSGPSITTNLSIGLPTSLVGIAIPGAEQHRRNPVTAAAYGDHEPSVTSPLRLGDDADDGCLSPISRKCPHRRRRVKGGDDLDWLMHETPAGNTGPANDQDALCPTSRHRQRPQM